MTNVPGAPWTAAQLVWTMRYSSWDLTGGSNVGIGADADLKLWAQIFRVPRILCCVPRNCDGTTQNCGTHKIAAAHWKSLKLLKNHMNVEQRYRLTRRSAAANNTGIREITRFCLLLGPAPSLWEHDGPCRKLPLTCGSPCKIWLLLYDAYVGVPKIWKR